MGAIPTSFVFVEHRFEASAHVYWVYCLRRVNDTAVIVRRQATKILSAFVPWQFKGKMWNNRQKSTGWEVCFGIARKLLPSEWKTLNIHKYTSPLKFSLWNGWPRGPYKTTFTGSFCRNKPLHFVAGTNLKGVEAHFRGHFVGSLPAPCHFVRVIG